MVITSANNSQGVIKLRTVQGGAVSNTITQGTVQSKRFAMYPASHGQCVEFVSRPTGPDARLMTTVSSLTNTFFPDEWESLILEINSGPNSTAVVQYEIVWNIEFTFGPVSGNLSNVLQRLARQSPASNPLVTDAAARVQSQSPSFFSRVADGVANFFEKKAASVVGAIVGAAAGGYTGGPAGAIAGARGGYMLMDGPPNVD